MPAWLIPYWIADMLMTLGLVLIGVGSAGTAPHLAPHTAPAVGSRRHRCEAEGRSLPRSDGCGKEDQVVQDQKEDQHRAEVGGSYFSESDPG